MADISLLHDYADTTKSNSFITSIALFIIVTVLIAPVEINYIVGILAKIVAIGLLGYVLINHSKGVLQLFQKDPEILFDTKFQINTILCCIFPITLVAIMSYVLITFVV